MFLSTMYQHLIQRQRAWSSIWVQMYIISLKSTQDDSDKSLDYSDDNEDDDDNDDNEDNDDNDDGDDNDDSEDEDDNDDGDDEYDGNCNIDETMFTYSV